MKTDYLVPAAFLGAGLLGLYLASKYLPGIMSGNNTLTRDATDASGAPVTAYQGAGVLGTAGAAANVASGGYLSTFGSWLGSTVYDLTHSGPDVESAQSKYTRPAPTTSGAPDSYIPALSFYGAGASFKDLSDPDSVMPWNGAVGLLP